MKNYQNPKGTYDVLLNESNKWQKVEGIMSSIASFYGFKEIRTPIFEYLEVFKRDNDSSDMVNKEMYTFSTNDKYYYGLRPEGTAGIVRSYVQNKLYALPDQPVKMYYYGPMFRHEHAQKDRYRQFEQFGIETIGAKSPLLDAEGIALGYTMLKTLGVKNIRIRINSLGDKESRDNYRIKLVDYFTPKKELLCEDCKRRLIQNPLRILDCKVDKDSDVINNAPLINESLNDESRKYFEEVLKALDDLEIPYVVDHRLVRGLDYYTDTVFEVENLSENAGAQATIFAGGRYDGLVNYFNGPDVSGFGFALGVERLLSLLDDEGIDINDKEALDVYVMSLGDVLNVPFILATKARALGYRTDFNFQPRSLKAQFKTVDRLNAKVVVIVGEDELKNHQINIKDIQTQNQVTIDIDDFEDTLDKMLGVDGDE